MNRNIGSFGARLTRDQTVADGVRTKVAFNELRWDTTRGFHIDTGCYTVGRAGKLHFAIGVRLLASDVPNRYVDLLLYKNGEPRKRLTPDSPFTKPDSVPLASRETPWAEYVRGFSRGEVVGNPGDLFEIYVRHDFGERAEPTLYYPEPADEHTATDRHLISFMGMWQTWWVSVTEYAPVLAWSLSTASRDRLRPNRIVMRNGRVSGHSISIEAFGV